MAKVSTKNRARETSAAKKRKGKEKSRKKGDVDNERRRPHEVILVASGLKCGREAKQLEGCQDKGNGQQLGMAITKPQYGFPESAVENVSKIASSSPSRGNSAGSLSFSPSA